MELSYTMAVKSRQSIMIIDDNTNPNNRLCGNLTGMFCSGQIDGQRQIIQRVRDAYKAEGKDASAVDESSYFISNNLSSKVVVPASNNRRGSGSAEEVFANGLNQ